MICNDWIKKIDVIDYAFQPIVNPVTGIVFAVEALMRNCDKAGFDDPHDFFDAAYNDKCLFQVDILLREIVIRKFKEIDFSDKIKLFYNYDPRILEMDDYRSGNTENILEKYNLNSDQICLEINEKYKIKCHSTLKDFVTIFKNRGIQIALDDFGSGFAGFELFYHSDPNFLKFDKFLITDIDKDIRKKSFCFHIINLCKLLGIISIAEGIETEMEFNFCKDLGFDLVQGFFIEKPSIDLRGLTHKIENITLLELKNKRNHNNDSILLSKEIIKLETISINDNVQVLFEKFHDKLYHNFFPVLDSTNFPMGIIHERNIKKYVYSPYGKDLLTNKSITKNLFKFITKIPIADINTTQDKILEIFVNNPESEGVIIIKDMKYEGFLNAQSLLKIINEKNLIYAREINPLSKLPGNILINKYINDCLKNKESIHYLVYFDFDYFKPFNDKFGFRQGDRAITIFSDILKKNSYLKSNFIGHIGGDDFFSGIEETDDNKEIVIKQVKKIIKKFNEEILIFYPEEDIKNGFYTSIDRNGTENKFSLLSVCAAIIELKSDYNNLSVNDISKKLAGLKKEAKKSLDKIAFETIDLLVNQSINYKNYQELTQS